MNKNRLLIPHKFLKCINFYLIKIVKKILWEIKAVINQNIVHILLIRSYLPLGICPLESNNHNEWAFLFFG